MYQRRLRRRSAQTTSGQKSSPSRSQQQNLSLLSPKPMGVRLPSLSPKYKHPFSDKEVTLQHLELQSIFRRLDITPSSTRQRSPLVSTANHDIPSVELHVPCTTSIPEEAEAAEFVTALITRQPSPYKRTGMSGLGLMDFKAEQILREMSEAAKGRETPIRRMEDSAEPLSLKSEAHRFWRTNISTSASVRWDQFEESLLLFLDRTMVTSLGNIRKVDWQRFFKVLCEILAYEDLEEREWPTLPDCEWKRKGRFRRVLQTEWVNFVTAGSLNHTILMAIDRERAHYFAELYQNAVPSKVYTYGSADTYQGQWKLSKRHGQGLLRFSATSESYYGQFSQGLREGYGVMQATDCLYKGDWRHDQREGYGVLQQGSVTFRGMFHNNEVKSGRCTWGSGQYYDGEWENAQFCGYGKFEDGKGTVMTGQWKEGKLHGNAVKQLPNGEVMKGEWVAGVMEGEGEFDLQEKRYSGSMSGGLPHGQGEMAWKGTGSRYRGEWQSGKMQGQGQFINAAGDIFQGGFTDGEIENGEVVFADGRRYCGELRGMQMNGLGVLTYPLSSPCKEYRGSFQRNLRSGVGTALYADNSKYEGSWAEDEWHGSGILLQQGEKYEGNFAHGMFEGHGVLWRADGSSYSGSFSHNQPHGFGEIRDSQGAVKKGFFEAGVLIGVL